VETVYKDSWVSKYFNFETRREHGIIYFWNKSKKVISDSSRFIIYVYVPKDTKPYFFPLSLWKLYFGRQYSQFLKTDYISKIPHGFLSRPFPTSKSLYYESPFFLKVKMPYSVTTNYLNFKNFYVSNEKDTVLGMVDYNEDTSTFQPIFKPTITIPTSFLTTNNILEIRVYDTNENQILVSDYSQLFIILSISNV